MEYNECGEEMSRAVLITSQVSAFIPPSLRAFCLVKEVISWSDAGGGTLEIHQWQIGGSGSQPLEMMKFYFRCVPTCTHLTQHRCQLAPPAASMLLQAAAQATMKPPSSSVLGSGLSSSIRRTQRSMAGTSGSDQNIWVLLGTLRFPLSQHS